MLILAVDDDADDLEIFRDAVLKIDRSIDVMFAHNGEEALNFLFNKAITLPDFVFLDINMPRVDGRKCLIAIRNNRSTQHLPVIMYSTTPSEIDKKLFASLNARFLTKATTYEQLTSTLKTLFSTLKKEHELPVSLKPR